jgi:hypothetical protein
MKIPLVIKLCIILPVLLFSDYILMVLIGCATCLFGFDNDFYCGQYCIFGKIILGLSLLFFGYLVYPNIIQLFKSLKNGTSTKKQENL